MQVQRIVMYLGWWGIQWNFIIIETEIPIITDTAFMTLVVCKDFVEKQW
jgi:hypothetical protein